MNLRICLSILLICFVFQLNAQILSGPMQGPVEYRSASIWCELKKGTKASLEIWKSDQTHIRRNIDPEVIKTGNYKICKFYINDLDFGTSYSYQIILDKKTKPSNGTGTFRTMDLWNYRKPAPDFSFLAGSCNYVNEAQYDRPGRGYGGDSTIYRAMAKEDAAFMLWLGDNWYYREVDYFSQSGLWYRAFRDRRQNELQPLLKSMAHLAIWDDHDYGPNNEGIAYIFKEGAAKVFKSFWLNPGTLDPEQGIYTKYQYSDVDFFLMDCRTFRTSDAIRDSIDGKPNPDKMMWGKEQMEWLKNQLANSRATFKIIVNGSNILNTYNKYDCLVHFPVEYNGLLNFIEQEKINGVICLTGDRHHSEGIKHQLKDGYPLYDFTNSSLTAGVYKLNDYEKSNPALIPDMLVEENNYSRISISGAAKDRRFKIEFLDKSGMVKAGMEINEQDLRFGKKM